MTTIAPGIIRDDSTGDYYFAPRSILSALGADRHTEAQSLTKLLLAKAYNAESGPKLRFVERVKVRG